MENFIKFFFEESSIIFQEYFRSISPKAITKVVKKQMGVVHVISFTPYFTSLCGFFLLFACWLTRFIFFNHTPNGC